MSKDASVVSPAPLSSSTVRWLALGIWVVVVVASLIFLAASVTKDYEDMLVPCTGTFGAVAECNSMALSSAEVAVLAMWGWTTQTYATIMLIPIFIVMLGYWLLAGLIMWRQGTTWFGMAVSLALIISPISTFTGGTSWTGMQPILLILVSVISFLGQTVNIIFLYLLPNGRFSPKWAYIPLSLTMLLLIGLGLEINDIINLSERALSWLQAGIVSLALLGATLQIYRYLRDSNAVERQQTKWIIFGVLSYVLAVVIWILVFGRAIEIPAGRPRLLANFVGWFGGIPVLLILPAAITIAIMRYRLWAIDSLIRRTLIYSVVSAVLLLVYFTSILLIQSAVSAFGGQQSAIVTVLSTLLIAALFSPLRGRIQATVDKRFYRSKYDAQQTLARFAATARDEVDLEKLSAALVAVIQETMQPESVSIWLKPSTNRGQQTAGGRST